MTENEILNFIDNFEVINNKIEEIIHYITLIHGPYHFYYQKKLGPCASRKAGLEVTIKKDYFDNEYDIRSLWIPLEYILSDSWKDLIDRDFRQQFLPYMGIIADTNFLKEMAYIDQQS